MNNNTKCSQCSNCGECCTEFIFISKKEIEVIKDYIKKNNIKPEPLIENGNIYVLCPFRNRTLKKCNIYPVRPEICKLFKCNQDFITMQKNKIACMKVAKYNQNDKNVESLRKIFYGDDRLDVYLRVKEQ